MTKMAIILSQHSARNGLLIGNSGLQIFRLALASFPSSAQFVYAGSTLNLQTDFQPGTYIDQQEKKVKYSDFINKELILFSMADLQRSIPSMVDGLKPGQRKILFCSFKRNFVKEAKVRLLFTFPCIIDYLGFIYWNGSEFCWQQ